LALVGYHREWSPGIHTLFLGGRLENDQRFSDTDVNELILSRNTNHEVVALNVLPFDIKYRSVFEAWTAELNQILQFEHHIFVLGGRFQTGTFETTNALTLNPSNNIPVSSSTTRPPRPMLKMISNESPPTAITPGNRCLNCI